MLLIVQLTIVNFSHLRHQRENAGNGIKNSFSRMNIENFFFLHRIYFCKLNKGDFSVTILMREEIYDLECNLEQPTMPRVFY